MELVEGVAEIENVDRLIERLGEIGATHGCVITAFDARYLVGRTHVEQAVELAKRAVRRGENVADDCAIEVLLYAAGRRQIDRAIEIGVPAGEEPVVVCVEHGEDGDWSERANAGDAGSEDSDGGNDGDGGDIERRERAAAEAVRGALGPEFEPTAVLGAYDEALVREFYAISEAELRATDVGITALVGERVALLDVEK
jgi:KEOPS complex subunit Cgi121